MTEEKKKIEIETYRDLYNILNSASLDRLLKCKLLPIKVILSLNRMIHALKATPAVKCLIDEQTRVQNEINEINNKAQTEFNEKLKTAKSTTEKESIRKSNKPDLSKAQKLSDEFNDFLNRKLKDDENAIVEVDKAIINVSDIPTPEDVKSYFKDLESSKTKSWDDQIIDGEIIISTAHFIEWKD